ncbi:MAG: UvrD-helicase domain-containing protein [Granulosicoccus sp.]|nr:UvrD-helicase domain-containing protein [Granulosicoccus sp.]
MSAPVDAAIRERALDPATSFIVQAPAGSGKTELLTRRVLTLLATVDEPEQILAITFTRKAASEMRQRVIQTLERAASGVSPDNEYEAQGLALAHAVLLRDAERQWQLIRNPQRLNLRTIDALATQLAHRLPVTSALGAPTGVVEDATVIYREVAARFIDNHIQSLGLVLLQVGNRLELARSLLANLLAKRDQWKRLAYTEAGSHVQLRAMLEGMLAELIESRLENLHALLPAGLAGDLPGRLRMACEFLLQDAEGDLGALPVERQGWLDIQALPGPSPDELDAWRSIGDALLTATSPRTVRRRLTRDLGFPAKSHAKSRGVAPEVLENHKQGMMGLLGRVAEAPDFVDALIEVRDLPDPHYADDQWALLAQLLGVLPDLLVELQLVFAELGKVDFVELSERAQRALGTDDAPTDLALAMDLSLRHVLVDEFQDTSQTQFALFRKLVAGWTAGDGRTFFAVGDPMQSIYRFRDADVALFGEAQLHGIGPVSLESLTLTVNFRAAPVIIEWVNQTFSSIFPRRADANSGAVPYSSSAAHLDTDGAVQVHGLVDADKCDEASRVARLAADALATGPQHTVAILVRSRAQAHEIFAALRERDLAFEAIDMDLLGERAVVRDLVSLCLALRYPHDRLHWLSLLRAPFVGLTLHDLHTLMDDCGREAALIELLRDPARVARLSSDGQARLARFRQVIEPALYSASRSRLLPWVESVWLQLGGPVVCRDAVDRHAAEQALARLGELEAEGRLWEKSVLVETMKSLYAVGVQEGDCRIQIMTLHKAKGLEFDTVILPALDRKSRTDTGQLLNWFESTLDGRPQLLLAPLEQSGVHISRRERINRLVRKARERCDDQEQLRLLYVACTRARHHLHLLARASHNAGGQLREPAKGSLLRPLWPLLEAEFEAEFVAAQGPADPSAVGTEHHQEQMALEMSDPSLQPPMLERLPVQVDFPHFPAFQWKRGGDKASPDTRSIEFSWAGRLARDIGTVVHQQLQMLAASPDTLQDVDLDAMSIIASRQLQNLGVHKERLADATQRVILALRNTLADERGRWVLAGHDAARSEWALSVAGNPVSADPAGDVQQVVIDRTFVDEQGVRWIVDFKTGEHRGGQVDAFLDSEQLRYTDQLNRYADIIRHMDERPIRLGLYFPLLQGWREWEPPLTGDATGGR